MYMYIYIYVYIHIYICIHRYMGILCFYCDSLASRRGQGKYLFYKRASNIIHVASFGLGVEMLLYVVTVCYSLPHVATYAATCCRSADTVWCVL